MDPLGDPSAVRPPAMRADQLAAVFVPHPVVMVPCVLLAPSLHGCLGGFELLLGHYRLVGSLHEVLVHLADLGASGGNGTWVIFKKGEILRNVDNANIVPELIKEIEKL